MASAVEQLENEKNKFKDLDLNNPKVKIILEMPDFVFDELKLNELTQEERTAFFYRVDKESKEVLKLSPLEQLKMQVEAENNIVGDYNPDSYCDKCKNKGFIVKIVDDKYTVAVDCECKKLYSIKSQMRDSGLGHLFNKYSLEKYEAKERWQQDILKRANDFIDNPNIDNEQRKWFCILGQTGCGKSHLCTGIVKELILKYQYQTKYMCWRNEIEILNMLNRDVMQRQQYFKRLNELQTIPLLYIDDFMQGEAGTRQQDIAFQIIDTRYNKSDLITIISSELLEDDFENKTLIGRIIERCGGKEGRAFLQVNKDQKKNYRFKGF